MIILRDIRETETDWLTRMPKLDRDLREAMRCVVLVKCGDVPKSEMEEARSMGIRIAEA